MKILAIETSCDETAVAVIEGTGGLKNPRFTILGDALLSQALKHREYGGVYPSLAVREHKKNLIPMLTEALKKASMLNKQPNTQKNHFNIINNIKIVLEREPELLEALLNFIPTTKKPPVDAIAVTQGPGLEPALWVGLNFAKALSVAWNLPLVPTNHMEGHIVSVLLNNKKTTQFPAIALLVSGGHTELVLVNNWLEYKVLGQTRDDAVGEAFDKVARMLGLPYPGGPEVAHLAEKARFGSSASKSELKLPRPMIDSNDYDFSYSGLKTAVLYTIKKMQEKASELSPEQKQELAREFEDAAFDVLVAKTKRALNEYGAKTLIAGGGVVASTELRRRLTKLVKDHQDTILLIPEISLSTDNAVMIGMAAYLHLLKKKPSTTALEASANGTMALD